MSPRHFANYAKNDPKQYEAFSNSMWNGFVTVTHAIGLNRFFSFTPDFSGDEDQEYSGHFYEGEIPGDKELKYTQLTLW